MGKRFYLAAIIAGVVVPWIFLVRHFSEYGFGLSGLLQSLFVNDAASAFSLDLVISSIVFWALVYRASREEGSGSWVKYVIVNLVLGLCVAIPLFLYDREK